MLIQGLRQRDLCEYRVWDALHIGSADTGELLISRTVDGLTLKRQGIYFSLSNIDKMQNIRCGNETA